MYPEIFTIPGTSFSISSFGVMLALAFLSGAKIAAYRMREENLDPELAWTLLLYVMIGGIGGSKLYFAIDMWLREGQPFLSYLLSRGGITWYGGLIGAVTLGGWGAWRNGLSVRVVTNCCAIPAAVGQAMGRIGCFLVGDDYGVATDAPWGIAFPNGLPPVDYPVHPTQLYEVAWLLAVAFLLWKRRHKSPFLFGEYLALNGAGRLVIEHWRRNPAFLGLTEPQWIGILLIVLGSASWIYYRGRPEAGTT
jgi:phosphatidylglycerol:prolipoprotein diacylglycerol transferase